MSMKTANVAMVEVDEGYDRFEAIVAEQVGRLTGPLFTTNADPDALWDAYLSGFPAERRQHYTCHECRRFIQKFGGLMTINADGLGSPAVWDLPDAPDFFREPFRSLHRVAYNAKVNGVFLSSDKTWGSPAAGGWNHLSGTNPAPFVVRGRTAEQAMAELREDFKIVQQGLADYRRDVVEQAVRVLDADVVDRSEKTLGVAKWFLAIHQAVAANPGRRSHLIWRAVATAPPGFAHVRSTMISTLLDDLAAGLPFDDVARRWAAKMHPLRYQRPVAAPKAGNIEQAERLVAQLGVSTSLLRRFATLDDVLAKVWVPRAGPAKADAGGVFGHLRRDVATVARPVELPTATMTWEKFARTVLPGAFAAKVLLPAHGNYYGLLTATDPSAPAIIQWDGLDGHPRNPVSVYVYSGGSPARRWGVSSGWADLSAIFLSPHAWQEPSRFAHQGPGVFFAVSKCQDIKMAGLALFPEILRSEFHGIRSVIEAHSRSGGATGAERGDANGLAFSKGAPVTVRVEAAGGPASYVIDRMD